MKAEQLCELRKLFEAAREPYERATTLKSTIEQTSEMINLLKGKTYIGTSIEVRTNIGVRFLFSSSSALEPKTKLDLVPVLEQFLEKLTEEFEQL